LDERKDWLNRPKQTFQIHYHGDINSLTSYLQSQGWKATEPSAWKDVWAASSTDESSENITIIPTNNNGKIETIIFSKRHNDKLLALHLWQQPLQIDSSMSLIYSGHVSNHEIVTKFGLTFWKSFEEGSVLDTFISIIKHSTDLILVKNNNQYFIQVKERP